MSKIRGVRVKPEGFPCDFVREYGVDEFGLFFDFVIENVRQRMRWIEPGELLKGSPEDETQHKVILTKGYWLADTAVTQELWQAVMDRNPSRFKGKELPVEQVSWDDCRKFIDKLNNKVPGLYLRFPTEAEWEFACRAGTTTPFSFGENITPDQVNYNGNYPYADEKKGAYREKTVEVKELPCNAWGLFQMHGNVWEWCGDYYAKYPEGPVNDPEGPKKGEYKVLRGGSWSDGGRNCRSAYRSHWPPGRRLGDTGLRLARGHQVPTGKSR